MRTSNRPTTPPTFDVIEYARSVAGNDVANPFESNGSSFPPAAPSQVRMVTRPKEGSFLSNETWATTVVGVPCVISTPDELKELPLDPRAGFLLSLMDGTVDFETVIELSGLDRSEALALIRHLFDSGTLEFR